MAARSRHIVEPERRRRFSANMTWWWPAAGRPASPPQPPRRAPGARRFSSSETAFSAAPARPAGSARSAACTPTFMASIARWCTASPPTSGRASTGSAASTRRISLLANKIMAQAYDISAYKAAADDLVLVAPVPRSLFHAMAVGVVMRIGERDRHAAGGDQVRAGAVIRHACSSMARATAISRHGPARPSRRAIRRAACPIPPPCSASAASIPQKAGRAWETIPKLMEEAENKGETASRAKVRSCARRRTPSNGAPT